jgi:predicted house-cleaning NTP pyrophosphatase (Maf/HAM1 superfamily)
LRDNEKNLKKHILGNPFSIEKAEEMLQTLKGRKRLE